jgi:hypothetical protein
VLQRSYRWGEYGFKRLSRDNHAGIDTCSACFSRGEAGRASVCGVQRVDAVFVGRARLAARVLDSSTAVFGGGAAYLGGTGSAGAAVLNKKNVELTREVSAFRRGSSALEPVIFSTWGFAPCWYGARPWRFRAIAPATALAPVIRGAELRRGPCGRRGWRGGDQRRCRPPQGSRMKPA